MKGKSEKLKYHKKLYERKTINRNFSCDPKSVYHTMKGNRITSEKMLTKYEFETFWKNIWRAPDKTFNEKTSWSSELEMTYCSDVKPKKYEIAKDTLKTAVNKIHLGKPPGRNLLIGYWFKKFTFYIEPSGN